MLSVLRSRTYRRLFIAHVIALIGMGLVTVALEMLACNLAGTPLPTAPVLQAANGLKKLIRECEFRRACCHQGRAHRPSGFHP